MTEQEPRAMPAAPRPGTNVHVTDTGETFVYVGTSWHPGVCDEAADEIEHLRVLAGVLRRLLHDPDQGGDVGQYPGTGDYFLTLYTGAVDVTWVGLDISPTEAEALQREIPPS